MMRSARSESTSTATCLRATGADCPPGREEPRVAAPPGDPPKPGIAISREHLEKSTF
jgi:hypothetical protein